MDKSLKGHHFDDDISNKFDDIASTFLSTFRDKGEIEAIKILNDSLKDYSYEMVRDKEITRSGKEYENFALEVLGNKIGYKTYGTYDYIDDQRFFDIPNKG